MASIREPGRIWDRHRPDQEPHRRRRYLPGELFDLDDGYSKVAMVYTPDMENMFGKAHGGARMCLLLPQVNKSTNSAKMLDFEP
jgi:hypothetical protein